jgi:5-oxoprolinase (ATP-hydrolysing) subunit A
MAARTIDLNSDVGEGFGPWRMGDDEALMEIVSSINIACGFHAGDPLIMARTAALAGRKGVGVGAHPGSNDLWGFGRRRVDDAPRDIATMVAYQIGALRAVAAQEGVDVVHVKLHGALSNRAAVDAEAAAAVADAIHAVDPRLIWLVPSGSAMVGAADAAGLRIAHEVFADRAYDDDGNLLSRSLPGAVLSDPAVIAARAVRMVIDGGVVTAAGKRLSRRADSICVHGDTPGAVYATRAVRGALEEAGIAIVPLAGVIG